MSAFSEIQKTLQPLNIPVVLEPYTGEDEVYISVAETEEHGANYGDDEVLNNVINLEITLFCPAVFNYETVKYQIRRLMRQNKDFTGSRISYAYNPDLQRRALIFSYEYVEC